MGKSVSTKTKKFRYAMDFQIPLLFYLFNTIEFSLNADLKHRTFFSNYCQLFYIY